MTLEEVEGMIYLLNVIALTNIYPPYEHLFSGGSDVNLYLAQNYSNSYLALIISSGLYLLLEKSTDTRVLRYPLTCPLTKNIGSG